jgi:hypothetical protein
VRFNVRALAEDEFEETDAEAVRRLRELLDAPVGGLL